MSWLASNGASGSKTRERTMFKRIDHVEIVMDQPDRTMQFYTEVLGFTVKSRDRIERSGLGVPWTSYTWIWVVPSSS